MNSIKEQIDKNHPVIMGVKSFPNSDNPSGYHSVVAFGYKSNMVILSNGWDKSYHYHIIVLWPFMNIIILDTD